MTMTMGGELKNEISERQTTKGILVGIKETILLKKTNSILNVGMARKKFLVLAPWLYFTFHSTSRFSPCFIISRNNKIKNVKVTRLFSVISLGYEGAYELAVKEYCLLFQKSEQELKIKSALPNKSKIEAYREHIVNLDNRLVPPSALRTWF